MKRILPSVGVILMILSLICIGAGSTNQAHAMTTQLTPFHATTPQVSCEEEHAARIEMTTGEICLAKGSSAIVSSVTAIENYTDVTVRFFDRTQRKTFEIAPGTRHTFPGDDGTVGVPPR